MRRRLVFPIACAVGIALASPRLPAQIADQVIVFGNSVSVLRFDRRLHLLGETILPSSGVVANVTRLAIDGHGVAWIPFDPLHMTQIVRMASDGSLLPAITISYNPIALAASADGRVFGLTRIPLSAPGPAYGFGPDGQVLWSNFQGPSLYTLVLPQISAMTSTGQLWFGGPDPPPGKFWANTLLTRLNLQDGSVAGTYWPPALTRGVGDEVLPDLVATVDGTLWMFRYGPMSPTPYGSMENTDGQSILQSFPLVAAGGNGVTSAIRVDGSGKLYMVSGNEPAGQQGKLLYRFNPASPGQPEATYTMGGKIVGYALGANGDEAYLVIGPPAAPQTRRLERVNLVTGRKSSAPLDWFDATIAYGDPTGFIYPNIIDRQGDNDGDGISNAVETAAHSNPFDALSRPDGPKVFIDFVPGTNALKLIFRDPDGLANPQGGINASSVSVAIGNYGNVFKYLPPFATGLELSPDLTQATVTFGGLPLPSDKQWPVEVTVADKTGAVGWDWQVTPPGDL